MWGRAGRGAEVRGAECAYLVRHGWNWPEDGRCGEVWGVRLTHTLVSPVHAFDPTLTLIHLLSLFQNRAQHLIKHISVLFTMTQNAPGSCLPPP